MADECINHSATRAGKGVGHFERKFHGNVVLPQTTVGVRKLVPGLSRGVVRVILRLDALIQYRHVTHRQTHDDS